MLHCVTYIRHYMPEVRVGPKAKSFIRQCISDGAWRETTVMEVESVLFQVVRVRHCDYTNKQRYPSAFLERENGSTPD